MFTMTCRSDVSRDDEPEAEPAPLFVPWTMTDEQGRVLQALTLRCALQCRACQHFFVFRAVSDTLRCGSCLMEHRLGPAEWETVLSTGLDGARNDDGGGWVNITDYGDHFVAAHDVRLAAAPCCPKCWKPLSDEVVVAAFAGEPAVCDACATPFHVRPPGLELSLLPSVLYIGGEQTASLPSPTELTMGCPTCGGPVRADGSVRTPVCSYCRHRAPVPDTLWYAIHGPPHRPHLTFFVEAR
jgi:hypothetical protein